MTGKINLTSHGNVVLGKPDTRYTISWDLNRVRLVIRPLIRRVAEIGPRTNVFLETGKLYPTTR